MKAIKAKSIKINAIFNGIYQILALLTPLLTTPYISRVFGASLIGKYSYYYSYLSYFTLIAAFGFSNYGVKVISEHRDNKYLRSQDFWGIMLSKGLLSTLCLFVYLIITFSIFDDSSSRMLFLSMALYIVAIMVDPTFYFQGEEKFVSVSLRNIFIRILSLVLVFSVIRDSSDLVWYALIMSGSSLLSTSIMFFSFKKEDIGKPNWRDLNIKKHMWQSFSFFAPSLAVSLFQVLNQNLLGIIGQDDAQNGYYSEAMKFVTLLASLAGSISVIMLSRMSYLYEIKDEKQIRDKTIKTFQAFWAVALPCTFGLAAINQYLIPVFLGSGFEGTIPVLYIVCPIIIFSPLNGLFGSIYFRPVNKIWTQTYIIFFAAFLSVIANLILIGPYKAIGCAIGSLIAEFSQFPLLLYYSRKTIKPSMVFGAAIKPFDSSLIMFAITFASGQLMTDASVNKYVVLVAMILIGISSYALASILFKDEFVMMMLKTVIRKTKDINKKVFKRA